MKSELTWLTLMRLPGLRPEHVRALLALPSAAELLQHRARGELAELGWPGEAISALTSIDGSALERDLAWLQGPDHHLVTLDSGRYPPLLAHLPDAPAALFVAGEPGVLTNHQLAVVGSRNPTAAGLANAREFAAFIAAQGVTVTSGLAQGIDGAAHQGALEQGHTIAVLGTGPDQVYPPGHAELARRIVEAGALVSELPTGSPPRRENFPRRNRIISGMSLGTLVVEAARRSGSLITARLASEQGREVFAIPGSIHNPLSRGCHQLIRQGAKLVETAADIFEELAALAAVAPPPEPGSAPPVPAPERDPQYRRLLACLGHDPLPMDELARRTGLTTGELSSMLLILELEGEVISESGGRFARAPE